MFNLNYPEIIRDYLYPLPWIIFGLVFHEFCHAWVSHRLGDPLPEQQGRLTLNPLKHIDPIGLLAIILLRFGWAKPVQINPRNYQNPLRDTVWVSLAGPAGNFILAIIFTIIIRIMFNFNIEQKLLSYFLLGLFYMLALGFFNLIPIPPLDGSKILRYFLKGSVGYQYDRLEPYGIFILLILLFFTGLPYLLTQFIYVVIPLLVGH